MGSRVPFVSRKDARPRPNALPDCMSFRRGLRPGGRTAVMAGRAKNATMYTLHSPFPFRNLLLSQRHREESSLQSSAGSPILLFHMTACQPQAGSQCPDIFRIPHSPFRNLLLSQRHREHREFFRIPHSAFPILNALLRLLIR